MARILVVDDEVEILNALRRLLRRNGFEVVTAGSGDEALGLLETAAPEVVLSDFKMPGMNGAQFLAQVKQRRPLALRIMLSGCADLNSLIASVNDGEICRFISKPWDDDALVAKIRELLTEREVLTALHSALSQAADAPVRDVLHGDSTVEVSLRSKERFSVPKAIDIIRRFTGAIEEEKLAILSGLLVNRGGKLSFVAEVDGDERLSVAVPLKPRLARGEAQ